MGAKSMYFQTASNVPADADKFTYGDVSNNLQLLSCTKLDLKAGLGVEVCLQAVAAATPVSTGDKQVGFCVPASLNGYNLTAAIASVDDKGITGTTDVTIIKETGGVAADMLSTEITIGDEFFAADGVIDTTEDDVATGDNIYVNVDAVHSGTAPNGLFVTLTFSL
ncbi:MAG: hypothetical protein ACW96U_00120 [Candidatus Heimdallarchaeaceae archaeon]|jgi:hypothetical protein